MKIRFDNAHFDKVVLVPCLVIMMAIMGVGCSKGGGSSDALSSNSTSTLNQAGNIHLSGSVGPGYQAAEHLETGLLARMFATFGIDTPAFAALTDPVVDQVIAIPMARGTLDAVYMRNSVTSAINTDLTFSLTLANNMDWLLVLINSTATGTNRFVGSLALNAGSFGSLLNLPATDATVSSIDLGVVSRPVSSKSDAISANTVTAADFNMTASQLTTLAKTDALFRNARNIVGNYDPATGIYYELAASFGWTGAYSTLAALFSDPSYTSSGVSFSLSTNSTTLTMNDICNHTTIVEFIPSEVVSNGISSFGTNTPFSSSTVSCTATAGTGTAVRYYTSSGDIYANDSFGIMHFGPSGVFTVLPAYWEAKVNGSTVAHFDMAGTSPPITSDGRAKGFIPSFKVNVDGSNKITSVDIKWSYYDEASDSYIAIAPTDLKVLKHAINSLGVKFTVTYQGTQKDCDMMLDPVTVTSAVPSDPAYHCPDNWYYNDPSHPGTNTGLYTYYYTGGHFLTFVMPKP
jgi:hypothetical protein